MKNHKLRLIPLSKLDECPPFLVYALARTVRGGTAIHPSLKELAEASGVPERTFVRVSQKISWDSVKLSTIRKFLHACRVDPFAMSGHRRFLSKHTKRLPHLSDSQWKAFEQRSGRYLTGRVKSLSN